MLAIASKGEFWLTSGQTGSRPPDGAISTSGRSWTR